MDKKTDKKQEATGSKKDTQSKSTKSKSTAKTSSKK